MLKRCGRITSLVTANREDKVRRATLFATGSAADDRLGFAACGGKVACGEALCERLLRTMAGDGVDDDVALLAMQPVPLTRYPVRLSLLLYAAAATLMLSLRPEEWNASSARGRRSGAGRVTGCASRAGRPS